MHIKRQNPGKPGLSHKPTTENRTVENRTVEAEWYEVIEPESDEPLMLPAPRAVDERVPDWIGYDRHLLRMWAKCKRTGRRTPLWSPSRGLWWDERGCLEWPSDPKGLTSGKWGRPRSTILGRDVTPYIEFWAAKMGRRPVWTMDHLCSNRLCCDPDHLEDCPHAENVSRETARQEAFRLAYAA